MEVIIKGKLDVDCFVCGSKESMDCTFADKSFRGALCGKCLTSKVRKEVPNSQGKGAGGAN